MAEELGVDFIGYNEDLKGYSDHHLTSIVCRWDIFYRNIVQRYLKSELNYVDNHWLDMNTGVVLLTDFSRRITPEMELRIKYLKSEIVTGYNIFSGLIYDNKGNKLCAEDETISDEALLAKTNWLVRGVEVIE